MTAASGASEQEIFPPFRTRAPWYGPDLQTLRNRLLARPADLSPWPMERLELPLADGTGDRLVGALHRPSDTANRPLAVLIHGLTGCEDSHHIRNAARYLLSQGHPVLRLNLRGAGPSRDLCREGYHAGRSEDLRGAFDALAAAAPDSFGRGLVLVGYSLGANMLLKFLAESGGDYPVRAAASVSAPIDLAAAQRRIAVPRNSLYHRYLLGRMKQQVLQRRERQVACEADAVRSIGSIYEFDDRIVAPRAGFSGAADYYRSCSARRFLGAIEVPTLIIHAMNDPWIPGTAYRQVDWSAHRSLRVLLPAAGGHVGFHGRGSVTPWHDRCIARFFGDLAGS